MHRGSCVWGIIYTTHTCRAQQPCTGPATLGIGQYTCNCWQSFTYGQGFRVWCTSFLTKGHASQAQMLQGSVLCSANVYVTHTEIFDMHKAHCTRGGLCFAGIACCKKAVCSTGAHHVSSKLACHQMAIKPCQNAIRGREVERAFCECPLKW